jgi:hypothetical protein
MSVSQKYEYLREEGINVVLVIRQCECLETGMIYKLFMIFTEDMYIHHTRLTASWNTESSVRMSRV